MTVQQMTKSLKNLVITFYIKFFIINPIYQVQFFCNCVFIFSYVLNKRWNPKIEKHGEASICKLGRYTIFCIFFYHLILSNQIFPFPLNLSVFSRGKYGRWLYSISLCAGSLPSFTSILIQKALFSLYNFFLALLCVVL